jgi:hypothetical protein
MGATTPAQGSTSVGPSSSSGTSSSAPAPACSAQSKKQGEEDSGTHLPAPASAPPRKPPRNWKAVGLAQRWATAMEKKTSTTASLSDKRNKYAVRIQSALRGRLARRSVSNSLAAAQMWDSGGTPVPSWLDSLPQVEFERAELKRIRTLKKTHAACLWKPRCDGDYFVGLVPAADEAASTKAPRVLMRAWDVAEHETYISAPAPAAAPVADGLDADSSADAPPDTPVRGSGTGAVDANAAASNDDTSMSLTLQQTGGSTAQQHQQQHQQLERVLKYSFEIEVAAVLSPPTIAGKLKVLRARRPKALAADAPDNTTFRGERPLLL